MADPARHKEKSMHCANHPESEASANCVYCGKPFCSDCLVDVKGRLYCRADIGNVVDEAKSGAGAAGSMVFNIAGGASSSSSSSSATAAASTTAAAPLVREGPAKSRTVSLVLCAGLIASVGGLHRLYTGHIVIGLIQLFTLGGLFVWQLIDLLAILSGTFRDATGRVLE